MLRTRDKLIKLVSEIDASYEYLSDLQAEGDTIGYSESSFGFKVYTAYGMIFQWSILGLNPSIKLFLLKSEDQQEARDCVPRPYQNEP